MVVMTHGPETCAAVHGHVGAKARYAASQIDAAAVRLAIEPRGWWSDPTGHALYLLLDAPNAHAVDQLMRDLELFHWNTIVIHPVVPMEAAVSLFAKD
jgi:muconolactone delta-isomerase